MAQPRNMQEIILDLLFFGIAACNVSGVCTVLRSKAISILTKQTMPTKVAKSVVWYMMYQLFGALTLFKSRMPIKGSQKTQTAIRKLKTAVQTETLLDFFLGLVICVPTCPSRFIGAPR